jgi:glycine cleavage system H protein
MDFPDDRRYTKDHEWVRIDGTRATVGITDYAQDALGDVVFVDLPDVGHAVIAGATVCEIESTKSVSEIYAPLNGTIVEVNAALSDTPERVNSAPYADGWIFVVECADPAEVEQLMRAADYQALVS